MLCHKLGVCCKRERKEVPVKKPSFTDQEVIQNFKSDPLDNGKQKKHSKRYFKSLLENFGQNWFNTRSAVTYFTLHSKTHTDVYGVNMI